MTRSSQSSTRRQFLGTGMSVVGAATTVSGLSLVPRPLMATLGVPHTRPEPIPSIQDPRVKALAQHALDAARSAGATYADVRLTYTKERDFNGRYDLPFELEKLGAGVRALVDGYWGFASSPVWNRDEMARLGREAVRQAKVNSLSKPREVVWPVVTSVQGHWETPVTTDAFTVHPVEVRDRLDGIAQEMRLALGRMGKFGIAPGTSWRTEITASFTIQEKAFGSTEGSYVTQRLHRTEGKCAARAENVGGYPVLSGNAGSRLTLTGAGWELFDREALLDIIRAEIEASTEWAKLPEKPIDVGRYRTVFDASSVAALLSTTIGAATEIDRVMGYEANAGGTSYLHEPDAMLGTFAIGNEQLTVTANRSEPGGVATVQWDDEGVIPDAFTLVKNGVLHDFQTSREGAGWLRDAYARAGRPGPVRSHGGAYADSGQAAPMIHTANLVMQPGKDTVTFRDLEAQVDSGILVTGFVPDVDFQLGGGGTANILDLPAWELKKGKRVARLANAGILFRTTELWKNILALGGAASAVRAGRNTGKGAPAQRGCHSVTAVPMAVRDVTFIDRTKR